MEVTIKLRRTQQSLDNITQIAQEGEAVYSFTDMQFVIGDGTTQIKNLPRIQAKTWRGDVIGIDYGGTGNSDGYIRTGLKSGVTAGSRATAEGIYTSATGGNAHAEGDSTVASGNDSHAEGRQATASGDVAHAEGYNTKAQGDYSHAEGYNTTANGDDSHSEGRGTIATGFYSHAEGLYTQANRKSQHVFGEYNIIDNVGSANTVRGNFVEIVGAGNNENARSNIRTLDWSGNESIAGNMLPMTNNTKTLGNSSNRWQKLYVGSADSYGNSNTPIYWNNGVPTPVTSLSVSTTGSAARLTTGRSLKVALNSTTAVTFDGSANVNNIPVSGILPVTNGGTGYNSVDTSPTSGSNKMVTSGGVYTALAGKSNTNHTHNYAGSASVGGPANSVAKKLTISSSGSGSSSGTTYDGSAAVTISYNSVGAAASSHTHSYAGSASVGGPATSALTATKLTTARSIQTNLASNSAQSFNGTANIEPGVKGTLGIGNGGTGKTSWTNKGIIYADSTSSLTSTAASANKQILMADSNLIPTWADFKLSDMPDLQNTYVWDSLQQPSGTTTDTSNRTEKAWKTELGPMNMYRHGISNGWIHLRRGSLAQILLHQRIGSIITPGGNSLTISFTDNDPYWVPRVLYISAAFKGQGSSWPEHGRASVIIVDTYSLCTSQFYIPRIDTLPTANYGGINWGNSYCNSITINVEDFSSIWTTQGNVIRYFALT